MASSLLSRRDEPSAFFNQLFRVLNPEDAQDSQILELISSHVRKFCQSLDYHFLFSFSLSDDQADKLSKHVVDGVSQDLTGHPELLGYWKGIIRTVRCVAAESVSNVSSRVASLSLEERADSPPETLNWADECEALSRAGSPPTAKRPRTFSSVVTNPAPRAAKDSASGVLSAHIRAKRSVPQRYSHCDNRTADECALCKVAAKVIPPSKCTKGCPPSHTAAGQWKHWSRSTYKAMCKHALGKEWGLHRLVTAEQAAKFTANHFATGTTPVLSSNRKRALRPVSPPHLPKDCASAPSVPQVDEAMVEEQAGPSNFVPVEVPDHVVQSLPPKPGVVTRSAAHQS